LALICTLRFLLRELCTAASLPVVKDLAIASASTTAAIRAVGPKTPRGANCISDGSATAFFMLPMTNDASRLASIFGWSSALVIQLFIKSHVTIFAVGFVLPFFSA
jgi:hypothetical protein